MNRITLEKTNNYCKPICSKAYCTNRKLHNFKDEQGILGMCAASHGNYFDPYSKEYYTLTRPIYGTSARGRILDKIKGIEDSRSSKNMHNRT